ncbi:TrkA family potassium uptake protein [Christensenellaceae bacterium OttesenSCG-928-L17]|nr:TrkA family potassium uptake protein [Christensenellaceae bacterium OttesenSCG-928-L17]
MAAKRSNTHFAILGLGRFGLSIVQTLSEYDVNILACDRDEGKIQLATQYATHVVQTDVSDEASLIKLGLGNFNVVVLAMGEDFEASQIATMIAKEQGAKYIVVKARNERQKKILLSLGADDVILPEHEMGAKLARKLVGSNIMDILNDSEYYTISEMKPMDEWIEKSVHQADIRRKHGITVLAVRRGSKLSIPVSPDRIIQKEDILVVLSEKH